MKKIDFADCIESFFSIYLVEQRNASPATVCSYSDALTLLVRFIEQETGKSPEKQDLSDLSYDTILRFLDHLEHTRNNSIRTRNARLMFIRTFFRHIACRYPSSLPLYSRIATIPCKKTQTRIVSYLEPGMVKLLIETIDKTSELGKDEYLLLIFLIQTGLRVSELCNARFSDMFFSDPTLRDIPCLRVTGKGRKERVVKLNSEIYHILLEKKRLNPNQELLFLNRYGRKMSRHGINYILNRILVRAKVRFPELRDVKISPHILRHTCAMFLLQGKTDLFTISRWLGHSSIETTNIYVQANTDMIDKALSRYSFFEQPFAKYQATDAVLAKLDAIKKKCRSKSHINFVGR